MTEWIAFTLFIVGSFCAIVGAVGMIRLPDVYNRLHASTVMVVGGVIVSIIAAGLYGGGEFFIKASVIAAFIFITAPAGSHAIAHAAHLSGVSFCDGTEINELRERADS